MSEAILDIRNIINGLLKDADLSEAELARKINVPRATINRLASGRTPDPRASTLNAIAEYFGVSVDQLLGKQRVMKGNEQSTVVNTQSFIPIIEWNEAKNWENAICLYDPNRCLNWIMLDSVIEQGRFALQVNGESMWPQFQDNTVLIVAPKVTAKSRDFVVVYIKNREEIVFRQLILEGGYVFLKAINNIFPVIQLDKADKIIGVVIQTRKNFVR